ncbi:MAG: adenylate/guanylate cyclase domain-containing protein [Burkholderiaceae bacterium]
MFRTGGVVLSLLLAFLLSYVRLFQPLDLVLIDAQFKLLRRIAVRPAMADVVIVGIDETTAAVFREPLALWHPYFAKFLQAVSSAGAAVVGLDVVLPDRSFDAIVPGNDRRLLTGLLIASRNIPVVLGLTVDLAGQTRPIYPAFVTAAGSDALGYVLLPVDFDGVVRRFDELIEWNGKSVPTLAGQMARKIDRPVGSGLIDFAVGAPFDFIPLQTVLAWWDAGDTRSLKRAFSGKAVLLGSVLKYEDRHASPVNLVAWDPHAVNVPGVLLHAQALRSLTGDGLIQPLSSWIPLVLAMGTGLLWLWTPRVLVAITVIPLIWAICFTVSTVALANGYEFPVATIMFVVTAAAGGRQILETATGLRERRRLRSAFGGYVSPPVMQDILTGKLHPTLGGEKKFACVLFSDIRGYTTRSEHMSPEETIAFLNRYFKRIVPIIHAQGGTVISFMGDGIMAVFGVPNSLPNPCVAAYRASCAILSDRRQLNDELAEYAEAPLKIGIGLHAGEGVAGHIGTASRHDYSMIGDVTNVASRLEGVTKEVGYRLVCSRTVYDQLSERDDLVPLGPHAIKGHSPVDIFGFDPVDPNEGPDSVWSP